MNNIVRLISGVRARMFLIIFLFQSISIFAQEERPLYLDYTKPFKVRVDDLLSRMTLEEKLSQMMTRIPTGLMRFGIPGYQWGGEAGHCVIARANDYATIFPVAIAQAASWNKKLVWQVADAMSDEARPRFHAKLNKSTLTFWAPVVEMARDPRWGRTEECYGEDPYLTSQLSFAFVKGIQGDHPKYLKAIAAPKHFALNNEEWCRHNGSSNVDEQLLREYYLKLYQVLIQEAIALALNSGMDLECGDCFRDYLAEVVKKGMVSEATIDTAVHRILVSRFRLGLYDPEYLNPFTKIPLSVVDGPVNRELARESARQGIVNKLDSTKVRFVKGTDVKITLPVIPTEYLTPADGKPGEHGLKGEYFNNTDCTGEPVLVKTDPVIDFNLPGDQEDLVKAVYQANPRTIVVLQNGSAMAINWLNEHIPSIVEAWYSDEETGNAVADEVVQLYVSDEKASVQRPEKQLAGFERITLNPNQVKTVEFTISAKDLAFWDVNKKAFVVEPGEFKLMVGSSSIDIKSTGKFKVSR